MTQIEEGSDLEIVRRVGMTCIMCIFYVTFEVLMTELVASKLMNARGYNR